MNAPDQTEKRILLVDTNPFSLSGAHYLLQCDGVSVTTCGSMEEAVGAIERRGYAFVLIGRGLSNSEAGMSFGLYARERRPGTEVVLISDSAAEAICRPHHPDFSRCFLTPDGIKELYLKIGNRDAPPTDGT